MLTQSKLFLEDLSLGQTFTSGTTVIDEQEIKTFAQSYDPQPFHMDHEAAETSLFAGLAASGWHTASTTMRLLVEGGVPIEGGLIGAGVEVTWPQPTRPGDRLKVVSEVIEIIPSRTRPDRGIVTVHCETLNQHGSAVQKMAAKLVVMRRPAN